MKIAVTGSTGLIGRALIPELEAAGHTVTPIVRPGSAGVVPPSHNPNTPSPVIWDPAAGTIDATALEGQDAVIHLAGEPIAGLWTAARKRRVMASRVQGTGLLATTLGHLAVRPAVFVSASAIGIYGDRPADQRIDESSPRGPGFLGDVVEAWEGAADPARAAGIRVVHPRFGLILSSKGGALGTMLPVFQAGLGGRIGNGRQMWSWVAMDDVVQSMIFMLTADKLAGPVNVVAPLPVTNLAFTRTLGRVLHRPTILGVPAAVLKTVGGDMAREMLLSGARILPRKLQDAGYEFLYPELEIALKHVLAAG